MERTIVVGDVHGCVDELRRLLKKCGHEPGDHLVLTGDLVAKGPDSQGGVQLVREAGARAVMGNHDERVLRVRAVARGELPRPEKGINPDHQRVADELQPADWAYLTALPLFLRLGPERPGDVDTALLHAGAVPGVALEDQTREDLMTMRSIDAHGKATRRIEGRPWAAVWTGPERIIFGHDAVRGLQEYPLATGLDSGCVYGKKLTALILPERRLVSVAARRAYVAL